MSWPFVFFVVALILFFLAALGWVWPSLPH